MFQLHRGLREFILEGKRWYDLRLAGDEFVYAHSRAQRGKLVPNAPVYVYDTSGPYSDPAVEIDLQRGLPKLRKAWIDARADGETQMSLAKKGVVTPEMEYVAIRENMNCKELGIESHITPDFVREQVAKGRAVIPANLVL